MGVASFSFFVKFEYFAAHDLEQNVNLFFDLVKCVQTFALSKTLWQNGHFSVTNVLPFLRECILECSLLDISVKLLIELFCLSPFMW